MDISKKELIRIIKGKSLIWDRTNPDYRDKVQREIAWKEIYNAVNPDFESLPKSLQMDIGNQITKRWYNLRDAYVKSRKKSKRLNPNSEMSFLNTFYYYADENISETESNITDDLKKIDSTNPLEDFLDSSRHSENNVLTCTKRDDENRWTSKQRKVAAPVTILKAKPITVELIKLVEEKKLLWDKTSPNYRDKVKREEAWRAIFKAIEPTYDDLEQSDRNEIGDYITRKWNNVRDAYLKNIKNQRSYMYGDMLKFLNPHILDLSYSEIEYFKINEQQNEDASFSLDNSEDGPLDINDDSYVTPTKKSKFGSDSGIGSSSDLNEKKISTERLIKVIKKERQLWDRTSSNYNNKLKREESWKKVYKALVPNFDELSKETQRDIGYEISKRWYKVKNNYHRSKKNGVGKPSGMFSRILRFLDCQYFNENNLETEFINTNDLFAGEGNSINIDDGTRHFKKEFLNIDGDIFGTEIEKSHLDNTLDMADDQICLNNEGEKKLMAMLSNLIAREDDEDKSFFNAILSSVKSLSDDSKLMFRMNILKLIQALKKRDRDQIIIKQEPI